jgi:hypothetical protein
MLSETFLDCLYRDWNSVTQPLPRQWWGDAYICGGGPAHFKPLIKLQAVRGVCKGLTWLTWDAA